MLAAVTVAVTLHVQALGTVTATDTAAGVSPERVPLAVPATLVSSPARVEMPCTTDSDAVASPGPGHDTV